MKKILALFCLILAGYAVYFPLSYFGSSADVREVRVSHILTKTLEDAQSVKQKIEDGAKFEDAAKEYSIDETTKDYGGDLGCIQRGRLEDSVNDAVFKLKEGVISEPVESSSGWHLIKAVKVDYYSGSENFKYNPYKYLDL